MRISLKLTIAFSAVVITSGAAGLASVYIAEEALKREAGLNALQSASHIMLDIDMERRARVEDMRLYARDLLLARDVAESNRAFDSTPGLRGRIRKIDEDWKGGKDTPFIRSVLNNELSHELKRYQDFYSERFGYAAFAEIYVTNRQGVVIASTGRTSDYLQADEDWYQEAVKGKGLWVGGVEYDQSSGAVSMDIVVNILDEGGSFAGVLKGVLDIENIRDVLLGAQSAMHYKSVKPYLADENGLIIFSGLDPAMEKEGQDIRLAEFGEDISRRETVARALAGEDGYAFVIENGRDALRVFVHSKGLPELRSHGWSLIMDFDSGEILLPVRRVKYALLGFLTTSLSFIIVLRVMMSRSVTRPIERLRDAAALVGAGRFGKRIEAVSDDEIGELAAGFNRMAGDLQKTTVSRDLVENVFSNMMESLVVATPEGKISSVNRAALDMLGYTGEELVGRPLEKIFAKEAPGEQERLMEALLMDGPIRNVEKTYLSKDGARIPVLFSGSIIRGRDGKVEGIICSGRDISEYKKAEEEIRTLAKFPSENPNPVLRIGSDGTVLYSNEAAAPLLEEWRGARGESVQGEIKDTIAEANTSGKTRVMEARHRDRLFSIAFTPVSGSGYVYAYGIEVTGQKQAESEVRKLSAAIEQSSNIIFVTDADGTIEYVNPAFERVTGYIREEAVGQTPRIISSGETPSSVYEEMWTTIKAGGTWRGVLKNRKKGGGHYWCSNVISPVKDETGSVISFLAVQEDVTEKRASEERIKYLAFHDEMTGLLNRGRFLDLLGQETAGRGKGAPGVLLLMDIDQFKFINDSYGHGTGDEILKNVSRLLQNALRDSDCLIGRLGGDEFAVFLRSTDEQRGVREAERIRETMEGFRSGGLPLRLTMSIGGAAYPRQGTSVSELFTKADAAMYRAKEMGRNRCHFYRLEDRVLEDIHSRLRWKERILKALEEDRFEAWAQPIMDLGDGGIRHYEILARMRDEDGTVLLPGAFIEVAERFGIIGSIDRRIIKKTMELMSGLLREGRSYTFSINLSGKGIVDEDLLLFIQSAISETGVNPGMIVFEVTETAAVYDMERAAAFIKALKKSGCHFALDDFGVGFTSFIYLKELAVDYIKIDGSFIRNLDKNTNDRLFVRAIADVARGMGIKTVAEFVESEEALSLLKSLGVDYAQGYHIGKPAPFSERAGK